MGQKGSRSIESVLIFLDAMSELERLVMVAQGANLAPCLALRVAEDNKNYSQWDRILEPKSYACNCQTPGAFDRFFMPFDVTFEKSRVRMAIIGTSQLQQDSKSRARVQIPHRQLHTEKNNTILPNQNFACRLSTEFFFIFGHLWLPLK